MEPEEEVKEGAKKKSIGLNVEEYNTLLSYRINNNIKTMGDAIMTLISKVTEYEKKASSYESRIKDLEEQLKNVPSDVERLKTDYIELQKKYDEVKQLEWLSWIGKALEQMFEEIPGEEIDRVLKSRGPYRAAVLAVRGGWEDNSIKSMMVGLSDELLNMAKMEALSQMIDEYVQTLKEQKGIVKRETRVVTKAEPIDLQDIQNVRASPIVNIYYSLAKTEYKAKSGRDLPFETFIEECTIYTMNRKGYYLTFVTPAGEVYE
jgi:TolA-binding protein